MKLQTYILSAAAALAAFGVSLGLIVTIDSLISAFSPPQPPAEIAEPLPEPARVEARPAIEIKEAPVFKSDDAPAESVSCSFDVEGDYSLIGERPKGFEDFETLSIVTHDYEAEPQNAHGVPVLPKGSVWTKREYKFDRVKISGKKISFVTQARNGISYQFDGRFIERPEASDGETDYPELEGQLIKRRNGRKAAVGRVEFGIMCGC